MFKITVIDTGMEILNIVPEGSALNLEVTLDGKSCAILSVNLDGIPSVYWREDYPAHVAHTSIGFYARKGVN